MNEKVLKCLYDIQMSISEIDTFVETIPDDFTEYKKHTIIKRAVERNLEIIGEAINRILKVDPQNSSAESPMTESSLPERKFHLKQTLKGIRLQ